MKKVYNIVLTGGPCAGKSSALEPIRKKLIHLGYNVMVINETATELIANGISPLVIPNENFQKYLIKYLLEKEDIYRSATKEFDKKTVILYDRGALDCKAYLGQKGFDELIKIYGKTESELKNRYDLVLCFESVATSKLDIYSSENNQSRYENKEEAVDANLRTMNAWIGHPKLRVIKNFNSFDEKIDEALEEICVCLGVPKPIEIERKFLIKKPQISEIKKHAKLQTAKISQTYLSKNGDIERRIRKVENRDGLTYFYTEKKNIDDISRYENERQISEYEFNRLKVFKDNARETLEKTRCYFIYNGQYFELDFFPFMKENAVLELEMSSKKKAIEFPPFLEIKQEITFDPKYKNYNLAKMIKNNNFTKNG